MAKSFFIVVSIIFIIQAIMVGSFIRIYPIVRTGKVAKFCWRYKVTFGNTLGILECEGEKVNTSCLKTFYVHGNSLKDYEVFDGQKVLVSEFKNEKQKNSITLFPILVFHVDCMTFQSQYKLRKFVCYVSNPSQADWDKIHNEFKSRIKIEKADFVAELQ